MSSISPEEVRFQQMHASDNLQPLSIAAVIATYILACVAVGLRFYARKCSKVRPGWDDWLILAALFPLTAFLAFHFLEIAGGFGKHLIFANRVDWVQIGYIGDLAFYTIQTTLCKASILCFYCRIFRSRQLVRLCWVIGIFTALTSLATFVFNFLQCIPLAGLIYGGKTSCVNVIIPFVVFGVVNAVTDFAILAIPIYFVRRLNMRPVRKVQLAAVFCLGGLVCIFGVLRIQAMFEIRPSDITYTITWACTWSFCESSVGIVCACLPTLPVLFNKLSFKSMVPSRWRSSQHRSSGDWQSEEKQRINRLSMASDTRTASPALRTRDNHHYARVWGDGFSNKNRSFESCALVDPTDQDNKSTSDFRSTRDIERQGQDKVWAQCEIEQVEDRPFTP